MSEEDRPQGGVQVGATFGEPGARLRDPRRPERPFRLLVLGEFGGRGEARPMPVVAAGLAELAAALDCTAEFVVPNRLGTPPASLQISLPLRSFRDFDARTFDARVPEIAAVKASPRGPAAATQNVPPVTGSGAEPEEDDGNSLDRLLGMVDLPGAPSAPVQDANSTLAKTAVSAFVASVARKAGPTPADADAGGTVAAQVREIAAHPHFLALERAWRGLRLIAGAADAERARVILRDVRREDLLDLLAGEVLAAQHGEDEGCDAILVLGAFEASGKDFDLLGRIATAAAALAVPVIVTLDRGFFGVPASQVGLMDNPAALLDGPVFAAWRGLRQREESRLLFAAWNDVLLRPEGPDTPALWGEAGAFVATRILRSLGASPWPTEIVGSTTALGGFDVAEVPANGGHSSAIPLGALVDPGTARDLGRSGIICLVCRPDRDAAWLASAGSVHDNGAPADPAQRKAQETIGGLPFVLASHRIEAAVGHHVGSLRPPLSAAAAAASLSDMLTDLLSTSGAGHAAEARVLQNQDGDAEGSVRLEVDVQFGRDVFDGFAFSLDLVL